MFCNKMPTSAWNHKCHMPAFDCTCSLMLSISLADRFVGVFVCFLLNTATFTCASKSYFKIS